MKEITIVANVQLTFINKFEDGARVKLCPELLKRIKQISKADDVIFTDVKNFERSLP